MAVGKAGELADRDLLAIWFGGVRVAHKGLRDPSYDEAAVSQIMKRDEIKLRVDIGIGSGSATVWTCDLTKNMSRSMAITAAEPSAAVYREAPGSAAAR